MFGLPPEQVLPWADRIYFGAIAVTAIGAVVGGISGYAQYVLNNEVNTTKERSFQEYKLTAQRDIARAQDEAEQARLEQERLKAQFAWRTVTPEESAILSAQLPTEGRIRFKFQLGDVEASYYVARLARIFMDKGWLVESDPTIWSGNILLGVTIPPNQNSPYQNTVETAFKAARIDYFSLSIPAPFGDIAAPPNAGELLVVIGTKTPN